MPPNQSQQPYNPYDFILNGSQPQPKSKLPLPIKPTSGKSKVLLFGAIGVIVLMLLIILFSIFTGGKDTTQQLLTLAQQQQEIIRISNLGSNRTRTQDAANLSTNTTASVTSSQQEVITLIGKKAKLNEKTLSVKKDLKIDAELNSAAQNNQFDTVFTSTLQTKLAAYQKELKTLYDESKNTKTKTVLKRAYDGTTTLLNAEASSQAPN